MHPTPNEFIYQLKFKNIITLDSNFFYFFVRPEFRFGQRTIPLNTRGTCPSLHKLPKFIEKIRFFFLAYLDFRIH